MIREELLALADELEGMDCNEGCRTCPADGTKDCRGDLSCEEAVARAASRRIREVAEHDACEEAVTTVSAYGLLPEEDLNALAWVREHGGLGEVEKRLMPEGMEWPKVDGKPVDFKTVYVPSLGVLEAVSIYNTGACQVMSHDGIIKSAKDIHIEKPEVLDADGEPLEVGQTVYGTRDLEPVEIVSLRSKEYDGVHTVKCKDRTGFVFYAPDDLTHQRPVLDADGVPCREGDEVWEVRSHRRREIVGTHYRDYRTGEPLILCDGDDAIPIPATFVTHTKPEPPDTYAKLYEDVHDERCGSEEFVRRARALAGVTE